MQKIILRKSENSGAGEKKKRQIAVVHIKFQNEGLRNFKFIKDKFKQVFSLIRTV